MCLSSRNKNKKRVVQDLIPREDYYEARVNSSDQTSQKRAENVRGTLKSWSWPAQPVAVPLSRSVCPLKWLISVCRWQAGVLVTLLQHTR